MVREWYICYFPRVPVYWFAHLWKQGFRHVELARPFQYGPGIEDVMWIHVLPSSAMLNVELSTDPRPPWVRCPGIVIQKVTAVTPETTVRSWWDMGPPSCVEVAKMALGVRAFFVRTPWQLYKYISKRNGVLIREF